MDTLTNVNIEDDERTKKSHQNVKDFKEGYKAYDSEIIDEMTGEVKYSFLKINFSSTLVFRFKRRSCYTSTRSHWRGRRRRVSLWRLRVNSVKR